MPATYINPLTDFGFKKLFGEEPNKDQFDPQDRQRYEESLKYLRDLKNSEQTAREEGRLEGRLEGERKGKLNIARNLLDVLEGADSV